MKEMLFEIDERGNVRFEGKGFEGAECLQLTQEIEDALGEVQKRELKPEYRQARSQARAIGRRS